MNGVQTRFKCKLDVKRCKRFVFPPSSLLPRSNALKTKAIRYFQTDRTLTRIVSPPLKGVFQWFLKLIVGVQFTDCRFLKKEKQFIILANHNSHLDTLSLLASLPGDLLWKVKPVAAEDYFGKTRFQASISNFFINTLLIRRKGEKDSEHDPIRKMLEAIDAGYSLILFPEGTRGKPEQMGKIKSGIARILSLRPEVKYIPVFMTGMGRSLPKGKMILLPYKASIYYGMPALVKNTDTHEILEQITSDFERMKEKYQVVIDEEEE